MAPIDKNTPAQKLVHKLCQPHQRQSHPHHRRLPGSLGSYFVQCIAAAEPSCLILAGRNRSKIQQTAEEIKASHPSVETRLLEVDLSSLASVRQAAAQINSWEDIPAIDVVVNNAAIMATEYALSAEGVESQFATNHLGPFLLTNLIMGKVLAARSPRVVMVASDGHRLSGIRFTDYNFDVSVLFFCTRQALTWRRIARHIIDGLHMGRPRRRICSWPCLWLRSLGPGICSRSVCTRGLSSRILRITF